MLILKYRQARVKSKMSALIKNYFNNYSINLEIKQKENMSGNVEIVKEVFPVIMKTLCQLESNNRL